MNNSEYWNMCGDDDFLRNKSERRNDYMEYMFLRTVTMFDWRGLPGTIPTRIIERLLQRGGNACIFEFDGNIYATFGGLGGELDYNYEPTKYVIANPYLNYSAELSIGSDCVRMRNDDDGFGLVPMFLRYSGMMVENDISIVISSINQRMRRGIVADNDTAYESAKNFIGNVIAGSLAPMMSDEFFEGIHALEDSNSGDRITDLIEAQQYLKASWFNELGLNSNYNMKRERIAAPEAQLTDAALLPLVDMMLENRRRGCEEVNNMFGTEWEVDLAGAWLREHLKQQINGMDFDSDDDAEIDEPAENAEDTQDQEPESEGADMMGDDGNADNDDDGSNDADGGDDDSGDNEPVSDDGDPNVDIDITVNIDTNGDSGNIEVKEDDNDDEGTQETAD